MNKHDFDVLKSSIGVKVKKIDENKLETLIHCDSLDKLPRTSVNIIKNGIGKKHYDFKKIQGKIKNNESLYIAGMLWGPYSNYTYNNFDFEYALTRLEDNYYIYLAGCNWKFFNYTIGLSKLNQSEHIYLAGCDWIHYDYCVGLSKLINNKNYMYVYYAARDWKEIDHVKVYKTLLNTKYFNDYINTQKYKDYINDHCALLKSMINSDSL